MTIPPRTIRRLRIFDSGFFFLLAVLLCTGGLAIWLKGTAVLSEAFAQMGTDLFVVMPQLCLGILIGSLFTVLVPRHIVSRFLGENAGFRGLIVASLLGAIMPGGAVTSMPLLLALGRSGAGIGALIAFLVSWSAVGVQRILIWEIPFLGAEFSVIRLIASLPLPIIAGLLADYLTTRFPVLKIRWP